MDASMMTGSESEKGISGSTLKLIAVIAMLIDHTAAVVVEHMIFQLHSYITWSMVFTDPFVTVYWIMRIIGRLAFPIYIFLLIQGLEHTRNKWKYLLRLFLLALISEIPFDFAFNLSSRQVFSGKIIEFTYQNVFFTLTIGLLTIIGMQSIEKTKLNIGLKILIDFVFTVLGMGLAFLLQTDYGEIGVLAIVMMYLLRRQPMWAVAATCVVLLFSSYLEISAFLILLPLAFYNGKRGWKLKWVFYIFYPVHLLVLWLICLAMGII